MSENFLKFFFMSSHIFLISDGPLWLSYVVLVWRHSLEMRSN